GVLGNAISMRGARENIDSAHLDNPEKMVAYRQKALRDDLANYRAEYLDVTLDQQDLSDEYILLEVMNIRHVGPSLELAPNGDPSDGFLDVVLVTPSDREKLSQYILG